MAPSRMKTLIAALLLALATMHAQDKPKVPLTNDDVVAMRNGGLEESLILAAIDANDVNFDVSANGLLALKKAAVPEKIIQAMLAAQARKHNSPAPAPSAQKDPSPQPQPALPPASLSPTMATNPSAMNPMAARALTAQAQAMQMLAGLSPQMLGQFSASRGAAMGTLTGAMRPSTPTPPPTLDPAQLPRVTLVLGDKNELVKPSMTQIAKSEMKGGGAPGMGMVPAMGSTSSMASMAIHSGMSGMGGMGGITGLSGLSSLSMLGGMGGSALRFAPMMAGPGLMLAGPAMSLATGILGGSLTHHSSAPSARYVWALPGAHSAYVLAANVPKFEIDFADIVGLDPDAYEPALVKLTQTKDNWRLVGATKEKLDKYGNEKSSAITEDRTEIRTTALSRGHVLIEAAGPLPPGEYGVVLHPVKASKAGTAPGASLTAEQTIFYTVWDFSIPASEAAPPARRADSATQR